MNPLAARETQSFVENVLQMPAANKARVRLLRRD